MLIKWFIATLDQGYHYSDNATHKTEHFAWILLATAEIKERNQIEILNKLEVVFQVDEKYRLSY